MTRQYGANDRVAAGVVPCTRVSVVSRQRAASERRDLEVHRGDGASAAGGGRVGILPGVGHARSGHLHADHDLARTIVHESPEAAGDCRLEERPVGRRREDAGARGGPSAAAQPGERPQPAESRRPSPLPPPRRSPPAYPRSRSCAARRSATRARGDRARSGRPGRGATGAGQSQPVSQHRDTAHQAERGDATREEPGARRRWRRPR